MGYDFKLMAALGAWFGIEALPWLLPGTSRRRAGRPGPALGRPGGARAAYLSGIRGAGVS